MGQPFRRHGIIVHDARELLADVARMVAEAKQRQGYEIVQPGMPRRRER